MTSPPLCGSGFKQSEASFCNEWVPRPAVLEAHGPVGLLEEEQERLLKGSGLSPPPHPRPGSLPQAEADSGVPCAALRWAVSGKR